MKLIRRVRILLLAGSVCLGLLGATYAGMYGWIQWDAHAKAGRIWQGYPQAEDEVAALILAMHSCDLPMEQRNQAVWVLGRLADERALGALEQAYTGETCDHEHGLCQYELEKAIRRCGGEI